MELAPLPRPFRREGLFERGLPFVLATVVGLGFVLGAGPAPDPTLLAIAVGFVAVLTALIGVLPWSRLPRWTDLLPPLVYLILIIALRRRAEGLEAITVAPFFLIPTLWVALHGTTRDLLLLLLAAVAVRFGPGLARGYETGDVGQGLGAFVLAATVVIVTHGVVRSARNAERALRETLDRLPVGFAVARGGVLRYVNERLCETVAARPEELLGRAAVTLVSSDDRDDLTLRLRGGAVDDAPRDLQLVRGDGGTAIVALQSMPIVFEARPAVALVLRDVTDERRLETLERSGQQAVARERALLSAIVDSVDEGVALLDGEKRGVIANAAYLRLFGLDAATFEGLTRADFIAHVARMTSVPEDAVQRLADLSGASTSERATFHFEHPERRVMQRSLRSIVLSGEPAFLVVWHDITAHSDLVAERERQANLDPLTGVANRRGADEAVAREVARATRTSQPLSIVLIDVDHFKTINDRRGHQTGDEMLRLVAGVLAAQARATDTVARWGGDEFLVLVHGPASGARLFCDRARAALAAAGRDDATVTLSAGVAEYVIGEDVAATFARADAALYAAKTGGRDRTGP